MATGFVCGICGERHAGLPLDIGYQLPDCVWALPEEERAVQARFNTDLCQFEERNFLRGILYVPIPELNDSFGWGVWAEVTQQVFDRYLEIFERDARAEPPAVGTLANAVPGYPDSLGRKLEIRFSTSEQRPRLVMVQGEGSLAEDQLQGLSYACYHALAEHLFGTI